MIDASVGRDSLFQRAELLIEGNRNGNATPKAATRMNAAPRMQSVKMRKAMSSTRRECRGPDYRDI
jgi:hypothetical protein